MTQFLRRRCLEEANFHGLLIFFMNHKMCACSSISMTNDKTLPSDLSTGGVYEISRK